MMTEYRNSKGFTLIEIMITTVLIGIVAAMAAPYLDTAFQNQRFKSGNREVISTLRKARSQAIATKEPVGIYVDEENMGFVIFIDRANLGDMTFENGDSVVVRDTLSSDFTHFYTDVENSVILFRPNGSAAFDGGGNIGMVGYTERSFFYSHINVLASTGRIQSDVQLY